MLLQSCKIYIEGDREDIERVTNVICSFAEKRKFYDYIKHIQESNMAHNFIV